MLKFDVYTKNADGVSVETVTYETNNTDAMSELKDLARKASVIVAPVDVESATALMAKKPGGGGKTLDWANDVLTTVLELAANGTPVPAIKFEVYSKHGEMVNDDAVRKTVRGEANTHQDIDPELRAAATAAAPAKGSVTSVAREVSDADRAEIAEAVANSSGKGGRRKVSDEDRIAIVEAIASGRTGAEVAKQYGITSSTANKIYRDVYGYRKATA